MLAFEVKHIHWESHLGKGRIATHSLLHVAVVVKEDVCGKGPRDTKCSLDHLLQIHQSMNNYCQCAHRNSANSLSTKKGLSSKDHTTWSNNHLLIVGSPPSKLCTNLALQASAASDWDSKFLLNYLILIYCSQCIPIVGN